jgi:glycosyltransferase involved in cell wall biosynthesis
MYKDFAGLPSVPASERRPTVCIVSGEVVGPFKNGGIGTSMTGLAESLAGAGFAVSILYTGGVWVPDVDLGEWRERYRGIGIGFTALGFADMARLDGPLRQRGFGVPLLVYDHLRSNRFDVVHFNDCVGDGYYCLVMKRLGVAFQDSLLCLALHSPSQWVLEHNQRLPDSILYAAYNYAERLSTRAADLLWAPSRYIIEWAKSKGFVLPAATYFQQYVIPTADLFRADPEKFTASPPRSDAIVHPKEIVFFGRLEERKGLRVFCNAMERLDGVLAAKDIAVTFLGKSAPVAGTDSLDYLARRGAGWHFRWQTVTDLGQQEAIRYMLSRPALAVMPSPVDNSPCTIYEALGFGIPFIAARTGGIPELIDPADRDEALFASSATALADKLAQVIARGARVARPAIAQRIARRRWVDAHRAWRTLLPRPERAAAAARGLVAIVDHGVGSDLDATLASLRRLPMVRRIVVLNRSPAPVAAALPDPRLREISLFVDEPDTIFAELPDGDSVAVLLLQSGVTVLPEAVPEMLTSLQHEEIDGLVPAARVGGSGAGTIVPPLGGSPAFSFFEGIGFTGGLVIKAERFHRAVMGKLLALETEFLGLADHAVAAGLELWPYVEPVFCHPEGYQRRRAGFGAPARIAAYDQVSPTERYYIAALGYAAVERPGPPATAFRREVRLRLAELHLGWLVAVALRLLSRRQIDAIAPRLRRLRWLLPKRPTRS